ncbi:MAG: protein TolR [Francisellaceae bacterium]
MQRRTSRRTRRKAMVDINVVPYIDVMLVLLVIFMITAPMLTQGVKVDLPEAHAKAIAPENNTPLIVTVDKAGAYFLNIGKSTTAVSDAQLKMEIIAIKKQQPEKKVYVKGDRHASYGEVVKVMVLLQQAGVSNVGLITDEPDDAKADT